MKKLLLGALLLGGMSLGYAKDVLPTQNSSQGIEKTITQNKIVKTIRFDSKEEALVVNTILGQKLSVRDTELLVKKLKNSEENGIRSTKSSVCDFSQDFDALKNRLKTLGFEAKIKNDTLTIQFENAQAIHLFLEQLH